MFCMNENLANWLTFKTHWKNQETEEWEEPRVDQIGAAVRKYRRPEGGEKNARQQTVEKNKQAKKSPIWP